MRNLIARPSALLAAFALALLSACGIEDQDLTDPAVPVPPLAEVAPRIDQIDDQIDDQLGDQLESGSPESSKTHRCYTTCSSDPGKGWTKTYTVGTCSSDTACSTAAAGYCKGLSSGYKYHNSACT
jgi:hypothetical protein